MEFLAGNTFISQLASAVVGGLVTLLITWYINARRRRQRVKAVNKLERLEAKLKRFIELEEDRARAYLTLMKELVFTLRLATYFFIAILLMQLVAEGNAWYLFIGASIGILIAVSDDLAEHAQLARGLLEPEKYRRELEEAIKRLERLELSG